MPAKKIKIPDINTYTQFHPFLNDFFKVNKDTNKNFSFRFLAGKLGWSASYLNDVLQGRRHLSLNKILELIDYLGLKGVRAERLLLLALFESNGLSQRGEEFLAVRNSKMTTDTMTDEEMEILSSMRVCEVIEYLIWKEGHWNASDFTKRSRNPNPVSTSQLDEIIRMLEKKKLIRWDKDKKRFLVDKTEFYRENFGNTSPSAFLNLEKDYFGNYVEFLKEPVGKWRTFMGLAQVPEEYLAELADRVHSLRNFINGMIQKIPEGGSAGPVEVYQYAITVFPAFRSDEEIAKSGRS